MLVLACIEDKVWLFNTHMLGQYCVISALKTSNHKVKQILDGKQMYSFYHSMYVSGR